MLNGLLLLVGTALAGDVLVPTYTPASMSDFGQSERLTEDTLTALAAREIAFVPPSEIQRRAGGVADGCADLPDCTTIMWRHFDTARLAVVGSVTWDEGLLRMASMVRMTPRRSRSSRTASRSLSCRHSRSGSPTRPPSCSRSFRLAALPASPARSRTSAGAAPAAPAEVVGLAGPTAEEKEQISAEQDDLERRSKGMPKRAWKLYRQSGLDYEDWKDKALVRAGSVVLEFHGGAVFGDVDRSYAVRAAAQQIGDDADSIEQIDTYQYDAFVSGSTFMLGGSIGYVPVWWLETDVFGGFSIGQKSLSTGWELYKEADDGSLVLAYDHPDSTVKRPAARTPRRTNTLRRPRFSAPWSRGCAS